MSVKYTEYRHWWHEWFLLTTRKYFWINHGKQSGFFQFEIIINVSVSSFRFIWIPMLWVYGHYKYFTLSVRGPTLRQILTSKVGPRTEKVNVGPVTCNSIYPTMANVSYLGLRYFQFHYQINVAVAWALSHHMPTCLLNNRCRSTWKKTFNGIPSKHKTFIQCWSNWRWTYVV